MIKRIKDSSKTLPKFIDTSAVESKIDLRVVVKALGVEYIGNIGNLPLSKMDQERLAEHRNVVSNDEKNTQLMAAEVV